MKKGRTKTALIVVDMAVDMVTGVLRCDRAEHIIPQIAALIEAARRSPNTYVVYATDSHIKGVDNELRLWGDHCIRGTPWAEVVPELAPTDADFVVPKRRYSAFNQTHLHLLLEELGVGTTVLCGLHANICVQHTAGDAYQLGYEVVVVEDAVEAPLDNYYMQALQYMTDFYTAKVLPTDKVISEFS